MVGAMPRREGMERKDLLAANVKIFKVQGESLDKFAKKRSQARFTELAIFQAEKAIQRFEISSSF